MTEEQREKLKKIINRAEGNRRFTESLAAALGEATSTVSHKAGGITPFADWEIEILRNRYGLTADQVVEIFIAGCTSAKK